MQQKLFRKKQEIFGGCLKLNIKSIDSNSIELKGKKINLFFIFINKKRVLIQILAFNYLGSEQLFLICILFLIYQLLFLEVIFQ